METKRCAYCHKLQRAEARVCSRCGRSFERRKTRGGRSWRSSVSLFSLPAASPHHAGHYSGLHPEDQPYQSNKIVTPQRATKDAQDNKSLLQEPGHIVLPATQHPPVKKTYRGSSSRVQTRRQIPARRSRRSFSPSAPDETLPGDQETRRTRGRQGVDRGLAPHLEKNQPRPFARDVEDYELTSRLEETQPSLLLEETYPPETYKTYRDEYVLAEAPQAKQTQQARRAKKIQDVDYDLAPSFSLANDAPLLLDDLPTYMRDGLRTRPRSSRILSTVLIVLGFVFLLSTSIFVLILMGNRPATLHAQLKVTPQILGIHDTFSLSGEDFAPNHIITFTIDANSVVDGGNGQALRAKADAKGHFLLHGSVPPTWSVGRHTIYAMEQASTQRFSTSITVQGNLPMSPHLQLSTTQYNFGSSAPGVVSSRTITLKNSGGGTVVWQESSDRRWLTASPISGMFAQSENIQVDVNRGGIVPGDYTAHMTIRQQGQENTSSILTVTMTVAPTPAQMSVSVTALSYSTAQSQAPGSQMLTIGNTGEQALHWDAITSTEDGTSWLTLSLYHGILPPGISQSLSVQIGAQALPVGTYSGLISFTGNANAQVEVTLNVVAPGNLIISPPSLTLGANLASPQPTSQPISLQNSGDLSLDWSVAASTNDHGSWLSVTPVSGTLAPGESVTVSVNANPTNLAPGSYQGTLTFSVGGQTKTVAISFVVAGAPTTPTPTAPPTPTATALP